MAKEKLPDWDHWKRMRYWTIEEFFLLLIGKDPNEFPSEIIEEGGKKKKVKGKEWIDTGKPEGLIRQLVFRKRTAGEFTKFRMPNKKARYDGMKLVAWASNPTTGIKVPEELLAWLKEKELYGMVPVEYEPHQNTLINNTVNLKVLGAAIAVIAKYQDSEIKRGGKYNATEIARRILFHSENFWPEQEESEGSKKEKLKNPLALGTMADLISANLKMLSKE